MAPHCASVAQSGWQLALMQRNEAPQSESQRHCAVVGAVSVQAPLAQLCPIGQSLVVAQAAWHWPPAQTRLWPQAVSSLQSTTLAVPQLDPPFWMQRPPVQVWFAWHGLLVASQAATQWPTSQMSPLEQSVSTLHTGDGIPPFGVPPVPSVMMPPFCVNVEAPFA